MYDKKEVQDFLNTIDTCFKKRHERFPEFSNVDPAKLRRIGLDDNTIALFLTVPVEDVQACIDLDIEESTSITAAAKKAGMSPPSDNVHLKLARQYPDGEL